MHTEIRIPVRKRPQSHTSALAAHTIFSGHSAIMIMEAELAKGLIDCPVEILLDIATHLDLDSIFNFSLACKSLNGVFNKNKVMILLEALSKEFSPFDELLQVYTAAAENISGRTNYQPRTVIFKRFPGDTGYTIGPQPGHIHHGANYSSDVLKPGTSAVRKAAGVASSGIAVLTEDDLSPILRMCRLVRQWEQLFPQMRWFHYPADCRALNDQELPRFRRAFYRWWLYGTYFHGEWARPQIGHPMPFVLDVRTSQMRRHSTAELMELLDLHETMKDVILHYICPRLDPTYQLVSRSREYNRETSPANATLSLIIPYR